MNRCFQRFFATLGQYSNLALALIGSFSLALYLALSRLEPNRIAAALYFFLAILAALFLLLLLAAMIVKEKSFQDNPRWSFGIIIAFAVLFRLTLPGQSPWLSNDVNRYLWDAQLVDHGVNPYLFPPASDTLAGFREATIYPKMDHKNVHSVYPPFLQLLFWSGRKISQLFNLPFFAGLKLIFALADIGLVLALFRLLVRMNLDIRWSILYAWHPLPIIEIAGSGHTDGVGALMLLLALIFLLQRKYFFATIFLALGFLVKFITVLFLPFLCAAVWKEVSLKKACLAAMLFGLIIAGAYAPFAGAGEKLISGLMIYSDKWRFNDGFFSLVFSGIHRLLPEWLVIDLMIPPGWEINETALITRRIDLALMIAKIIAGGFFMLIYIRLLQRILKPGASRSASLWIASFIIILAAFFLLAPTLQPWYLIWLLPLLCLSPMIENFKIAGSMIVPLWLFSATIFLSYGVLQTYILSGVWREPGWVKWVEYGFPFLVWVVNCETDRSLKAVEL